MSRMFSPFYETENRGPNSAQAPSRATIAALYHVVAYLPSIPMPPIERIKTGQQISFPLLISPGKRKNSLEIGKTNSYVIFYKDRAVAWGQCRRAVVYTHPPPPPPPSQKKNCDFPLVIFCPARYGPAQSYSLFAVRVNRKFISA